MSEENETSRERLQKQISSYESALGRMAQNVDTLNSMYGNMMTVTNAAHVVKEGKQKIQEGENLLKKRAKIKADIDHLSKGDIASKSYIGKKLHKIKIKRLKKKVKTYGEKVTDLESELAGLHTKASGYTSVNKYFDQRIKKSDLVRVKNPSGSGYLSAVVEKTPGGGYVAKPIKVT